MVRHFELGLAWRGPVELPPEQRAIYVTWSDAARKEDDQQDEDDD